MTPEPLELHQTYGDVELRLDGHAHAWAWTPNTHDSDERFQLDLLPHLAFYCQTGRGKRVEPATWENDGSLTIVVSVDLGTTGQRRSTESRSRRQQLANSPPPVSSQPSAPAWKPGSSEPTATDTPSWGGRAH